MRLFYFAGFDVGASKGGRGQHVEGVVRGLHKLGWEVYLFSCKDEGSAKQPGFPFENILIQRRNDRLQNQIVDQVKLAWKLLWWKGPKPDLIYIRSRFTMLVPVFYARRYKIPYFCEINGLKEHETSYIRLLRVAQWIENWVLLHSAGVVPVTHELRDHFSQRVKLHVDHFRVISNGADPNIWTGRENPLVRKSDGCLLIGFMGHFQPRQGVETILRALPVIRKKMGDVRIVVAGTGSEKASYRKNIQELELTEYVVFPGYVPKDRIGALLVNVDVTVAPYTMAFARSGTGLSPLKMFSYLACEKIIVASDLEGLRDFRECPAVYFAEPDNVDDFADKVIQVLQMTRQERERIEKKARQYIIEGFTWDKVAERIAKWLQERCKNGYF